MRFLSGAGEWLCGGLASGAWEEMVSGSGAMGGSPSGASLLRGSTDSVGEPGGKSEQALMVRARRRCCPMCVRFLEKLFLFLEPLTLAGFIPGSSFTSRSGYKRHDACLQLLQQSNAEQAPGKILFCYSPISYLHDSWGIGHLWCGWWLLLNVTASPNLRLDATNTLQSLLPAFLSLLHSGKGLQNGLHLPLFSCLRGETWWGGIRVGGEE